MKPIYSDIEHFARRFGLRKGVEAAAMIKAAEKVLSQVLPETLKEDVRATSFNDGVLTIQVPSGSALATLKLYRGAILTGLKEHIGRSVVERIAIAPAHTNVDMAPEEY
jgi:hypothetical protein